MTDSSQFPVVSDLPIDQLTYEQTFTQLEQIVSGLELGENSLDAALALFERGQDLAHRCSALLDQAELKVQQILGDELVDFPASPNM